MAARTRTRARGAAADACHHLPPYVDGAGGVFMDWRTHTPDHRPGPCRICRRPTALRDCTRVRCHKVCAEQEFARDIALAAKAYGRS